MDTSAFVKRHVREIRSVDVLAWMRRSEMIGMSIITRAEVAATFARISRTSIGRPAAERLLMEFRLDWPRYIRLRVNERTVARADALAWQFVLRGYDAIHLASAVMWQEVLGKPVTLATYDRQLWAAAAQVGLQVRPESW
jgi:predicted nucleic acid-binding protein